MRPVQLTMTVFAGYTNLRLLGLWIFALISFGRSYIYVARTHLRHSSALQWRHIERDGISNHEPRDCLPKPLFRRRSKKNQSSALLAFLSGIHRLPVTSPIDDVIMNAMDRRIVSCHSKAQTLSTKNEKRHDIIPNHSCKLIPLLRLMQWVQYKQKKVFYSKIHTKVIV